jgi:hypothetical protein
MVSDAMRWWLRVDGKFHPGHEPALVQGQVSAAFAACYCVLLFCLDVMVNRHGNFMLTLQAASADQLDLGTSAAQPVSKQHALQAACRRTIAQPMLNLATITAAAAAASGRTVHVPCVIRGGCWQSLAPR